MAKAVKKDEDYKPSKVVFDRALGAIKLDKKMKEDKVLLDVDKLWLTENGDVGKTITIPGRGSVQIKSGSAEKPAQAYTNYGFSIEKFKALSPARQKTLKELGVVTITHGITPKVEAGKPTVAFIHNE